jgi:hypothetical protein
MKQNFHYANVADAVAQLKAQGYDLDFELKDNKLIAGDKSYPATDFEITDVYRYEGQSDPADEATVYALASGDSLKGILVTGYGASFDEASAETLKQLHFKFGQA